ncbi:MAG: ferrochelatase [Halobacteria archaeon]|nr:ferrochelatase [Halobacteria archaeon]
MTTGVVLLNFGEPEYPEEENVVPYLKRIFLSNMSLEGDMSLEQARRRAEKLAERRAPSLLEEYREMGGHSPLIPQARKQADMLSEELESRGKDVETYVGMQFTQPFIHEAVEEAQHDGVDRIIGLPVYPLCGESTTVQSLEKLSSAVEETDWDVDVHEITGWHRHPVYSRIRADNITRFVDQNGIDLAEPGTLIVYSAHGTPIKYLQKGSRYDQYVEESCETISELIGISEEDYTIGYQNHANRDIEWTQPETEEVIEGIEAERIVVVPISFMHEQSETLSELDVELREEAEELGLDFYRVPIPHDDPRFGSVLADLVHPFLTESIEASEMGQCRCKDSPGTMCFRPSTS